METKEEIDIDTLKNFFYNEYLDKNMLYNQLIKIYNDKENDKNLKKLLIIILDIAKSPYKIGKINAFKDTYINISFNEIKVIYQNMDFINNFYIKAKIYDYFFSQKIYSKIDNCNNQEIIENAIKFYLEEIFYLLNNYKNDTKIFTECLDRYLTLSTKRFFYDLNNNYIKSFKNINKILILSKRNKNHNYIKIIFDILFGEENNDFIKNLISYKNIIQSKRKLKFYIKLINIYLSDIYCSTNYILFNKIAENWLKNINIIQNILDKNNNSSNILLKIKRSLIYKIFNTYIQDTKIQKNHLNKVLKLQETIIFAKKNNIKENIITKYRLLLKNYKKNIKFYNIDTHFTRKKEDIQKYYYDYNKYNLYQKIASLPLILYNNLSSEKNFEDIVSQIMNKNTLSNLITNIGYDYNNNIKNIDNYILIKNQTFNTSLILLNFNIIKPLMENIYENHYLHEKLFENFVYNNFFIPEGHEIFFIKGFYYFFNGDIIEAIHLLLLQFENSLRYLLKNKSPITIQELNGLEKENINIEYLLNECQRLNLLDDKLIFYLKMIFLKEHMNLRNDIAHGFLNLENIKMNPTIYIFILLLLYIIIYENDNYNKNNFL